MTKLKSLFITLVFWGGLLLVAWLMPYKIPLLSQILIMGLFALSLDLVLGYAGILTVGHAAFFGVGAYASGLFAVHGWQDPIFGLIAASFICAVLGYMFGFMMAKGTDLARLTISIAVCMLLTESARQFSGITGGSDGLHGITMKPLFGVFEFDLFGQTAFFYAFVVVGLLFVLFKVLCASPFGLSLQAIKSNRKRMHALGISATSRLRVAYAVSAAMAGVAGALLAQTNQFVSVDTLSFERSAEVLIILVLGGAGRLYGGLIGAAIYMLLHDLFSGISPHYWMAGLGLVLITVSLFTSGGILGFINTLKPKVIHEQYSP